MGAASTMAGARPASATGPFPTLPITSEATLAACSALDVGDGDVFIASYPKSGTTWTQAIVSALVSGGERPRHVGDVAPFYEIDPHWRHDSDSGGSRYVGSPRAADAHARLGRRVFNTHLRHAMLPRGEGARIVYVVRDGADVCVSFFHHLASQRGDAGRYDKGLDEFWREWLRGELPYGRWSDHLASYAAAAAGDDPRVLVVSYEQLSSDLEGTARRIASHIGAEPLEDVAPFTFDGMRKERDRVRTERRSCLPASRLACARRRMLPR